MPTAALTRRGRPAPSLSIAVVAAVLAIVSIFGVRTVFAHSGLAAASPGPGAIVGGDIDLVQLFYGDLIVEFDGTITRQADGTQLEAEAVMTSEITAELRLASPIAEAGEYAVRHTVLSIDGDVVEAAYLFSYDPEAEPPILIFLPEEEDSGGLAWWAWTIIGVGALIIVVLVIRLLLAIRRARALLPENETENETASDPSADGT